jgi:hypothetical protein
MMTRAPVLTVSLAMCAASPALAEQPLQTQPDAYCAFVRNVARSQSAVLLSPQLFVNGGYVNGDDGLTGAVTAGSTRVRLTAGVRLSISELYQGVTNRYRADADCERYRAASELNAYLDVVQDDQSREGYRDKITVLERSLPRAERILKETEDEVVAERATMEELNATRLRVDGLRASLLQARQALAVAEARGPLPPRTVPTLLRDRQAAERAVERYEARQRRAQAWDLVLRGGYDRIFGIRDELPLFGIVSVAFRPGWLAQWHYDRKAMEARLAWTRMESTGPDERIRAALDKARAVENGERERLQQASVLLRDLEQRFQALDGLTGPRAQQVRDYLWFDVVRLRAEVAYLKGHLHELEGLHGEEP